VDESSPLSILLIEDDAMIASGLVYALEQEGYAVAHCDSVSCAINCIKNHKFDMFIIDMQLPDGIGVQIHEALNKQGSNAAVIYLTVVDDEGNIVRAFEEGASDYITKPFRLRELLARIKRSLMLKAAMEEAASGAIPEKIHINGLTIETTSGRVYLRGELIDFTALEYRLLLSLVTNRGRLLTRAQILDSIWDCPSSFVEDNTLTVYVKRLREKLDDEVDIETVRGIGYRVNT